ncbi:MAG TPA: methylthioribulose 1-phosphate dehydratase [Candidatus Acidoferrum sp.]|nr:methylthioribulose 1-phosphate dehydratase [Candidatus Acidoferrum sp.]
MSYSSSSMARSNNSSSLASQLALVGREFHSRSWALGTSGNYSAVLRRSPLRLLITSSGLDKSVLSAKDFLEIDQHAAVRKGKGKPSAETFLHLAVVATRNAGCVLHTHSVWGTLLSERHASDGGITISGYEMLKGLAGVKTHQHREWIPIFANDQDIPALAQKVEAELSRDPASHGFLLSGHGLYTWGVDLAQARRHIEIFEFLFEVTGRREFGSSPNHS